LLILLDLAFFAFAPGVLSGSFGRLFRLSLLDDLGGLDLGSDVGKIFFYGEGREGDLAFLTLPLLDLLFSRSISCEVICG